MIEVSVIVPVYNTEQYLSKCIESILGQTFKNFELLLVDDGSTDDSGCICDYYEGIDNRVKTIHKNREGVAKARNDGLNYALGNYIAFCDSDDYFLPNWIETLLDAMKENEADCVSVVLNRNVEKTLVEIRHDRDITDYMIRRLLLFGRWEIWNRLYKTEIIKKNNIQFCTNCEDFGEDLSFNLQYCLYCKKIVILSNNGYCHVTRTDSIMGTNDRRIRFNALNEVSYSLFKRMKKEDRFKQVLYTFPVIHYFIINNQYKRLIQQGRLQDLKVEASKIKKTDWMKQQIWKYLLSSGRYKRYFINNNEWRLSILKSHYLLHQNYQLLRVERKVKGIPL